MWCREWLPCGVSVCMGNTDLRTVGNYIELGLFMSRTACLCREPPVSGTDYICREPPVSGTACLCREPPVLGTTCLSGTLRCREFLGVGNCLPLSGNLNCWEIPVSVVKWPCRELTLFSGTAYLCREMLVSGISCLSGTTCLCREQAASVGNYLRL